MSIPRLAIHRPVTMFMISCIVILLGLISLTRLPVDLLPDISQPTINVNVAYARRRSAGDGRARDASARGRVERDLRRRNDHLAVVGRAQPGSSQLRVGHGPQRGDERHAHPARSHPGPAAGRRGSADDVQVRPEPAADHGHRRGRQLRPRDAAGDRRERAVAAVRADRGRGADPDQRRASPADSRRAHPRKDHGARPLGRSRRQHPADRERRTSRSARSTRAIAPTCCAARDSSRTWTRSATSSCRRRRACRST